MGSAKTRSRNELSYCYSDEPHATRRRLIMAKHPEIKRLMGVDPNFKWQVVGLVAFQFASFYLLRDVTSWWLLLGLAYLVGGVANHALMLAVHEISHNMAVGLAWPRANRLLGILASLPIGVPISIGFRKYHAEHHRYLGDEHLDGDIPTLVEAALFTSPARKALWCLMQPLFYTLRPLFVRPKPLAMFELESILVQLAFDWLVVSTLGWHILAYMIGGSLIVMGLHPVAGHFISEHTVMFDAPDGSATLEQSGDAATSEQSGARERVDARVQRVGAHFNSRKLDSTIAPDGSFLVPETCSYYGALNYLTFNVGHHVEHHDFPSIPGSKLPLLRQIAPEFYANLKHHTSWTYVIWRYITEPQLGPHARVRRRYPSQD